MKNLKRKITGGLAAGGLLMTGGCGSSYGEGLSACDKDHWGDEASVSIQSSDRPGSPGNLGHGEEWEPDMPLFVDTMPESPAAKDLPLRLLIVKTVIEDGQARPEKGMLSETQYNAELEVYNPANGTVKQVLWGPTVIDLATKPYNETIYAVGESALQLTGTFDPLSEGFMDFGASPSWSDFTLRCVKAG